VTQRSLSNEPFGRGSAGDPMLPSGDVAADDGEFAVQFSEADD
jgi:hypothetical protein